MGCGASKDAPPPRAANGESEQDGTSKMTELKMGPQPSEEELQRQQESEDARRAQRSRSILTDEQGVVDTSILKQRNEERLTALADVHRPVVVRQ